MLKLLTQASLLDPTVLPANPDDQQAKAHMWAAALDDQLTYPTAQQAIVRHYRHQSTRSITVADLNAAAPPARTGAAAALAAATGTPPPADLDLHPARTPPRDAAALAVACPWCRARPGQPCTRPVDGTGAVPLTGITAERRAQHTNDQAEGRPAAPPLPTSTVHPSRHAAVLEPA